LLVRLLGCVGLAGDRPAEAGEAPGDSDRDDRDV